MEWWQAIILGIVQGLTEFLPVSSSGHLMIFKEILGADGEGFLDFTVAVHFATVLATIVVFWGVIVNLFKGFFKFKYNDETDYVCKILVSLIPVALVGFLFKDQVEALFGSSLRNVGIGLCITAALLWISDSAGKRFKVPVRSGSTIATGLLCGVKREAMAQFSFLMVLIPIIGEQSLDLLKVAMGSETFGAGVGSLPLILGFISAFLSGLFACKVMIALVKKAKLLWFALYCLVVAALIFILS